mgnify:CR=1 FL=1
MVQRAGQSPSQAMVAAGKMRGLAVFADKRSAPVPEVPADLDPHNKIITPAPGAPG